MVKDKNKFISDIDFNKSSKGCTPCYLECKKIDKKINDRKISEIKTREDHHFLKTLAF